MLRGNILFFICLLWISLSVSLLLATGRDRAQDDAVCQFLCLVTLLFLLIGMTKIFSLLQKGTVSSPIHSYPQMTPGTSLSLCINCRTSIQMEKHKSQACQVSYYSFKKSPPSQKPEDSWAPLQEYRVPVPSLVAFHLALTLHTGNHDQCQKPVHISFHSKCHSSIFQREKTKPPRCP